MSLVNIWVSPDKALVGVDTESVAPGGRRSEATKMIPLAHANMILATRGHLEFMNTLFAMVYCAGENFDVLVERMPDVLTSSFNIFCASVSAVDGYDTSNLDPQEAFIVGWSHKHSRMLGKKYIQETASKGFVERAIDPLTISPWEGPAGVIPPLPSTVEGLEKVARIQATFTHGPNSEPMVGGRLLVAELTRDTMTITSRCRLGARNQPINALQ